MNEIANYLDHVDSLLADPQRVAHAATKAGTKVVGYIGDEIPVALILAANALPLRLRAKPGRATPRADQFMESAFAPALRAIAEAWLEGELNGLDTVVFPRSDDSSQRLYYYLCELQRRGRCGGPRPLLYDIARISRPASIDHHRDSTRRLAEDLGAKVESLGAALERVSRRDALMAEIRARCRAESPLPGALAWRLQQASGSDWREAFDDATREWLVSSPILGKPRRIVLAGDAHADDTLHRGIESAGGTVVLELTDALPGNASGHAPDLTSLDALADRFQTQRNPVLAMRDDPEWVARCARDAKADAVVFWLIEEDEAMPWEISRQMRALRANGMPTLLLTRQCWIADEAACKQVTDFITALEVQP
jgi:hypothetical protein